jgi:hypothetical protein
MKYVPGAGLTDSELRGDTTKADRPYYFPGNYENRFNYYLGSENDPFRQWEKFVVSQKPRPIKYPDLKEVVNVNISYANLPFKVRADYFRLNDEQVIVPLTVEVANSQLTFKPEEGRHAGKVGVVRQGLVPPTFGKAKLLASSLLLADVIVPLSQSAQMEERFVLGNVKVRPSVDKAFVRKNPVGLYLQAYNAAVDQATNAPSLRVSYRLFRDGKTISQMVDESGESLQYFSDQRAVLIRAIPTADLEPGRYQVRVEIQDRIAGQTVTATDEFQVVGREAARK